MPFKVQGCSLWRNPIIFFSNFSKTLKEQSDNFEEKEQKKKARQLVAKHTAENSLSFR